MQTSIQNKSFKFTIVMLLTVTSLIACAADKYKDPIPSKESALTIKFSPEGGVTVTDRNGSKLERCFLPCTEQTTNKYNKTCQETDPEKLCKGLIDATVTDIHAITIIESTKNPYCYTRKVGNWYEQVCYK